LIVEALDEPPLGIIDIVVANDRSLALNALAAESRRGGQEVAGRWLLADVLEQLNSKQVSAPKAARLGKRVVQSASLPDKVYLGFVGLEEYLQLAEDGIFGAVDALELDLAAAPRKHAG